MMSNFVLGVGRLMNETRLVLILPVPLFASVPL